MFLLITDIYHIYLCLASSETAVALLRESLQVCLRNDLMFLASILWSFCLSSSMFRFITRLFVLAPLDSQVHVARLRASLLTVLRVVYAIVFPCSGRTMVSILHVDLISCRYLILCTPVSRSKIDFYSEFSQHFCHPL